MRNQQVPPVGLIAKCKSNFSCPDIVGVLDNLDDAVKRIHVHLLGVHLGAVENLSHSPRQFAAQACQFFDSGAREIAGERIVELEILVTRLPQFGCRLATPT
jgi:hypothetical protein